MESALPGTADKEWGIRQMLASAQAQTSRDCRKSRQKSLKSIRDECLAQGLAAGTVEDAVLLLRQIMAQEEACWGEAVRRLAMKRAMADEMEERLDASLKSFLAPSNLEAFVLARARTTVMCEREGYLQGFASVRVRTFLDIRGQAASDSASRRGRALPGMAFVGWPCLQGCRHREAAGRLQAVSQAGKPCGHRSRWPGRVHGAGRAGGGRKGGGFPCPSCAVLVVAAGRHPLPACAGGGQEAPCPLPASAGPSHLPGRS
jgi:hypothetical protein